MKQFWISLPVKDINKSKEFFTKLGFTFNLLQGNTPSTACLMLGDKNVVCMLCDQPTFRQYSNSDAHTGEQTSEVLLSIDAQSKEEVDKMIEKVISAGGKSTHKPTEMTGWMYGCLFTDLDGHRWNILYMDMSKMPQG
jgi:uncharacterized protein